MKTTDDADTGDDRWHHVTRNRTDAENIANIQVVVKQKLLATRIHFSAFARQFQSVKLAFD
jgi:hypothetical protein